MAVFDGFTGINVASGFKLQAQKPLDIRTVVSSTSDLDLLVSENGAYEGMLVYCMGNCTLYICTGSGWDKVFNNTDSSDTSEAIEAAITALSVSGKTITYTRNDGTTGTITTQDTVYTHPSATRHDSGGTNAPTWGETFSSISVINTDSTGHITGVTTNTVTVPTDTATTSAAGLMSASDKQLLDDINGELYNTGLVNGIVGMANGVEYSLSSGKILSATLESLDASLLTGTIDIARLPAAALERCVVVANDTARYALTEDDIQLGDTVKVTATNLMYMVVDTDNLDNSAGYTVYSASVSWANVSGKTNATSSAAGLMSASDKAKLDAIDAGATAITVDSALSSTSTNPVQNKVIYTELADKLDTYFESNGYVGMDEVTTVLDESIKSLSVSGKVITYTKNDGTTGTITTQDTNTTYSAATSSAAGLMSAADKIKLDSLDATYIGDAITELYDETYGVVTKIEANDTGFQYTKSNGTTVYTIDLPQIYFASTLPTTATAGSICCVIEE